MGRHGTSGTKNVSDAEWMSNFFYVTKYVDSFSKGKWTKLKI